MGTQFLAEKLVSLILGKLDNELRDRVFFSMSCHVMSRYVMSCSVPFRSVMLCYVMLCFVLFCSVLFMEPMV